MHGKSVACRIVKIRPKKRGVARKAKNCKFGCCHGVRQMERPKTAEEYLAWFTRYYARACPKRDARNHSFFQLPPKLVIEIVGALWGSLHNSLEWRKTIRDLRQMEKDRFGKEGRWGSRPKLRKKISLEQFAGPSDAPCNESLARADTERHSKRAPLLLAS